MIPIFVLTDQPFSFFQDMRLLQGRANVIRYKYQLRGFDNCIVFVKTYSPEQTLDRDFLKLLKHVEVLCGIRKDKIQKIEL